MLLAEDILDSLAVVTIILLIRKHFNVNFKRCSKKLTTKLYVAFSLTFFFMRKKLVLYLRAFISQVHAQGDIRARSISCPCPCHHRPIKKGGDDTIMNHEAYLRILSL